MKQASHDVTLLYVAALLLIVQFSLRAEQILLSGTVLTETVEPIIGASVYLKSSNITSIDTVFTDSFGRFKITNGSNSTITGPKTTLFPSVFLNGSVLNITLTSSYPVNVTIHSTTGRRVFNLNVGHCEAGFKQIRLPTLSLGSGVYIISVDIGSSKIILRQLVSSQKHSVKAVLINNSSHKGGVLSRSAQIDDSLVITADGYYPKSHPVTSLIDSSIRITLHPVRYDNVTPSYPVTTANGGYGNVTTYGSVDDPEFSQGGACNYGSTRILYYAAINVHEIPGDYAGNWQSGQACGRCARVRVLAKDGWRSAVVRITDRCADAFCGIDLGGAAARMLMDQPGRYHGEWEWVSCEGDSVSDGPSALYVKEGSNAWWSLVQVRNGNGSVAGIRARKTESEQWQDFSWATEAENFYRVPDSILQDENDWDIEIIWDYGSSTMLRLPGKALAEAGNSYLL